MLLTGPLVSRLIGAGSVLVLVATACCAADLDERSGVLEKLRAFDAVYSNGLTFRGTVRAAAGSHAVFPPIAMSMEFTVGGSFQGIVLKAMDDVGQVTADNLARAKRRIELAKDGSGFIVDGIRTSTIGLETARAVYFDSTKAADMQCSARYGRGPDGNLQKSGDVYLGNVTPPDAPDLTLQYKKIMWSSGRGVSSYIDQVIGVDKSPEGRLLVQAEGFESQVNPGKWELEIEPTADYMIRKGRFTRLKGDVNFEFTNQGVRKAEGLLCPASAKWTQYLGSEESVTEIRYDEASLSLDKDILAKARAAVEDRSRPNTMVLDRMGGKPIAMHVDAKGRLQMDDSRGNREEAVESFVSSWPTRKWVFLAVNCAAILALLLLLIRSRFRRASSPRSDARSE